MAKRAGGAALAVLSFVASALPASAQDVPLSLAEALDLALQHNPEVLAQRARTTAETARADGIERARWPRLSLSSGWSRSDTPALVFAQKLNSGDFAQDDFAIDRLNSPGALSHLETTLAAELPVDVSGSVKARAEAQSSRGRASEDQARETAQDVRLRVVDAYRRAALAQRVAEVAERALTSARARETDMEARVGEGASLRADLLRVRSRRRQREADLAASRADCEVTLAILSRAVGTDATVSYRPIEQAPVPPPLEGDGASWQARALANRPSIRMAAERLKAQAWAKRAEERSGWPELSAWGQLRDDRGSLSSGGRSGAFGLLVRWTVFDPTHGKRVAAAAAESDAAGLELRASRDQVRLEVEIAWRRASFARDRYAAAAGGAEEGREALRVVQERRKEGLATLTDELETEAASLMAELDELRVGTEAAIADAALLRAAGGL